MSSKHTVHKLGSTHFDSMLSAMTSIAPIVHLIKIVDIFTVTDEGEENGKPVPVIWTQVDFEVSELNEIFVREHFVLHGFDSPDFF